MNFNPTAFAFLIIGAIVVYLLVSGKYRNVSNLLGITKGNVNSATTNQSMKPPQVK